MPSSEHSAAALPRFLSFGEALTDMVRVDEQSWHSAVGGSCLNVARVASALGLRSAWCGAVSDDLFGQAIIDSARAAGLDLRYTQRVAKPPLLAIVHQTRPPQYFFIGNDAADLAFDERMLPAGWEDACEFAHFGCISLVRQPLASRLIDIAAKLKARGTRISFDPNYRNLMGASYPAVFEKMASLADLIKISDEDAFAIYPGWSWEQIHARIRACAPDAMLLYTRGADGMSLYTPQREWRQAGYQVHVADTVGAGDSCLGAFITSLLTAPQADAAEHLRFAAATAALVCTHAGAYAPRRDEVDALIGG